MRRDLSIPDKYLEKDASISMSKIYRVCSSRRRSSGVLGRAQSLSFIRGFIDIKRFVRQVDDEDRPHAAGC